ncbi:phage tail tip lysozyme [Eubacterium aggregans]|uniref:phage tail tip lysozyme n=2 Tax=Eubacterium aggregans TaxID=81409 RepID=UPI003F2D92B7
MKEDGSYCDPMKYIGIGGGTNEEIIWNYLKSQGLSDVCVAGIMGNIEAESGYDPTAVEGNGIGHGLCQWSFGRWENLSNFAASEGKDWSDINLQLDYFWSEIPNYEARLSAVGFYTQTDVNTATKIFCDIFGAPNKLYAHYDRRYEAAQRAYSQFAGR